MELKDIAIIEPDTKVVINVVRDVSIERAQSFFPGMTCVERKANEMHEPGCMVKADNTVLKRADAVTETEKKLAEAKATALSVTVKG